MSLFLVFSHAIITRFVGKGEAAAQGVGAKGAQHADASGHAGGAWHPEAFGDTLSPWSIDIVWYI